MNAQERADKIVLDWNKSTISTPIALMIAEAIEDAERDAWNAAIAAAAQTASKIENEFMSNYEKFPTKAELGAYGDLNGAQASKEIASEIRALAK